MFADRFANADLGLKEAVFAAFAGAVKEQDDRPFLLRRPILRYEDFVFVTGAMNDDRPVKEAGLRLFRVGGRGRKQREEKYGKSKMGLEVQIEAALRVFQVWLRHHNLTPADRAAGG